MSDPVEEFIGQQLHSISNIDAGMMPKKTKGPKPWRWWPYQHTKPAKSFNTDSHEDRLIAAIDKKRKYPRRSREEIVEDMLSAGEKQKDIAETLKVSRYTIWRETKKIKLRLAWERSKK